MLPISYYFDKLFWGTIWVGAMIAVFCWGFFEERARKDNLENKHIMGIFLYTARGAARNLNFLMAIILLPVCRNFTTLLGRIPTVGRYLPLDKKIRFHITIAWFMALFTLIHTVAHWINVLLLEKVDADEYPSMWLAWGSWAGATGQGMIFCMIFMYTSAMPWVRKQCFELFWYLHHFFVVFFFCALTHSMGCLLKTDSGNCYKKRTWLWVSGGLIIYFFEIVSRYVRASKQTEILKVVKHPHRTFEIQFKKPSMVVRPGEYIHISVPEISALQWHPFTLTSCQDDNYHSIHIRVLGDWTEELAKKLGCMNEQGEWVAQKLDYKQLPKIKVDGPFGSPAQSTFDFNTLMLVGAGIGVTPFAALLKYIWHTIRKPGYDMKLKKVYFVWICRNTKSFEWFQDLLSEMESDITKFLDIDVYLTGRLSDSDRLNLVVSANDELDPITSLKSKTHYGRPNIPQLFFNVKHRYHGEGRLDCGVFYCGPPVLGHMVRKHAHVTSDSEVKFTFRKEIF